MKSSKEEKRKLAVCSGQTVDQQSKSEEDEGSGWIDAPAAQAYLGMPSLAALYAACHRGQIPCHHLGKRLRFRRSELDAVISGN